LSHIWHPLLSNLNQKWCQFEEGRVVRVLEPRFNENPVLRLQLEILSDVVNDDGLGEIAAHARKILDVEIALGEGVLAVEAG